MKYVLLLSSPSSHTVDLVTFISMLVLDTSVFITRGVYSGCYDVFICIRGNGLGDEKNLVPHVVEWV